MLLLGIVFLAPGKLATIYLAGIGKPQYYTYMAVAGVAFTVIFDVALIPKYSINGAAIASMLSYCLSGIIALIWFKRETTASLRETLLIKKNDWLVYKQIFPDIFKNTFFDPD